MKTTETKKTFLTYKEVLKNGNNTVNQKIKGEFIDKHVYMNVNIMAEYILKQEDRDAPFSYEDIENLYSYPEYIGTFANFEGGSEDEKTAEIERLEYLQNSDGNTEEETEEIKNDIFELERLENECQDIFEYWAVSSYLAEKLSKNGYCIISEQNIWGRTTTGQGILLDYIITKICADMEILQGQANSWE